MADAIRVAAPPAPSPRAEPAVSLTQRASLNVIASLLDYGAKIVVGVVVIPIVVATLGSSLYGVWEMLSRLSGYLTAGDGRPVQALRLVVSNLQNSDDDSAKRRYVGGAFAVWVLFLPLLLGAGAVLVWVAPTITKADAALSPTVRLTVLMLTLSLMLGNLASLPESVLRGMNLGYKRMGLQAGLEVACGALMVAAMYLGFGMVGAASAQAAAAVLLAICFWWVVRKYVTWFGVERPHKAEVRSLLRLSLWVAGGDTITKLVQASDVIILGMVLSPAAVTPYVLTAYAARLALNLHVLAASGAIPGIGGVIGLGQRERAIRLRNELIAVTWLFSITVGVTILAWNHSFLRLWVGSQNYGGTWVNLLLVAIMAQSAFVRSDAYIIDAALQPRQRVLVAAIALLPTVGLATLLAMHFGAVGLCIGIFSGRLTQSIAYPRLARTALGVTSGSAVHSLARPAAVTAVLFASAVWLGDRVVTQHWVTWGAGVAGTAVLALALALGLGLPAEMRGRVLRRYRDLIRKLL